jgi:hypothetical protein
MVELRKEVRSLKEEVSQLKKKHDDDVCASKSFTTKDLTSSLYLKATTH